MTKKILIFYLALISIPGHTLCQHFVNQAVTGGSNDGSSWDNAFSDLQTAIASAAYGDTIWVAQGVYYPTATDDRSIAFPLKNGIKLYGGFSGTESSIHERDWEANPTILSGDIGNPGDITDNAFHVILGRGADSSTVLDGFTIRDGNGSNAPFSGSSMDPRGAGLLLLGAWDISETSPIIANCRFERNYATLGGGLYCSWKDEDFPDIPAGTVNPRLKNCQFVDNYAAQSGGGMMKVGPTSPGDTLLFDHCTFLRNNARSIEGGGLYIIQPQNSSIRLLGCVFEKDSALTGGGLTFYPDYEGQDRNTLLLDSCIFKGNVGSEGGGLYFEGRAGLGNTQFYLKIENCVFESNKAQWANGAAYLIVANKYSKVWVTLHNCLFLNNKTWTNITSYLGVYDESEVYLNASNCSFIGNDPNTIFAAPLHCVVGGSSTSVNNIGNVNVSNCLFAHNGSGVAMLSGETSKMETHIRNCTFFNNNKYIFTKSNYHSYQQNPNSPFYNRMYIDNCIAWEPKSSGKTFLYNNILNGTSYYQFKVNNSMFTVRPVDTILYPGSAFAYGDYVILNQYPEFVDTLTGDFRLLPCSPLMDKGNNNIVVGANLLNDLDGNPRIRFSAVDLGAYEVQDSCIASAVLEPRQLPLHIWPNPSIDGHVKLSVPEPGNGQGLLTIYDLLGKPVMRQNVQVDGLLNVDLSHLRSGKYFLHLSIGELVYVAEWMKF